MHPCETCGRPLAAPGSDLCDHCASFGEGPHAAEAALAALDLPSPLREHIDTYYADGPFDGVMPRVMAACINIRESSGSLRAEDRPELAQVLAQARRWLTAQGEWYGYNVPKAPRRDVVLCLRCGLAEATFTIDTPGDGYEACDHCLAASLRDLVPHGYDWPNVWIGQYPKYVQVTPRGMPLPGQCQFEVNGRRCERTATRTITIEGETLALCDADARELEA